uniref:Molybdopterin cofactor biosynthesis C (MoaC) domain-containing protein n=1 Tax=Spongospora subterranea TaxID=70186 RepID=A0A0H5RAJ3_9EUKA|eukprot:CRZ10791.1 hypothetical protein [Spongospora subterranea]
MQLSLSNQGLYGLQRLVLISRHGMRHFSPFSHINMKKNQPNMVDIGAKDRSFRVAMASCTITLPDAVLEQLKLDENEIHSPKGPVFATAIVAGTMAAKRTSDLIPFCHSLPLESCKIDIIPNMKDLIVQCTVKTYYKTGVEMEALTGASITALCIYDMCKSISSELIIKDTRLCYKRTSTHPATDPLTTH